MVDRTIEAFVEGVGLHDMADERRAVEAVGRLVEAGVGVIQVRELVSTRERKQGGLN